MRVCKGEGRGDRGGGGVSLLPLRNAHPRRLSEGGRGRLRKLTSNGPNHPTGLAVAVTAGAARSPEPPPPPPRASR